MKYYRSRWLFSRQRKLRQQKKTIFIIILVIFLLSLFGIYIFNSDDFTIYQSPTTTSINCRCSKSSLIIYEHGECFFDELICYPGYTGNQCEIRIKNEV